MIPLLRHGFPSSTAKPMRKSKTELGPDFPTLIMKCRLAFFDPTNFHSSVFSHLKKVQNRLELFGVHFRNPDVVAKPPLDTATGVSKVSMPYLVKWNCVAGDQLHDHRTFR